MKNSFLLILLLFTSNIFAQDIIPVTFGPLVSMTSTSLNADPGFQDQISGAGYNIGGFTRVKVLFLYGQLEAAFSSKSTSATIGGTPGNSSILFRLNGLDVSLLAGKKLFSLGETGNCRVFLGYNLNNYSDVTYSVDGNKLTADNVNDNNSSIIGGVGVDVSRLTLDLKYLYGLSDISSSSVQDVTTNVISLTLGFKIL